MKKLFLLPFIFLMLALPFSYAVLDADTTLINITINYPTDNLYNASGGATSSVPFIFNISVKWSPIMNITNGTLAFVDGTNITYFVNTSINGSAINVGGLQTLADWKFNISASTLREGDYTVYAVVYNESTSPVDNANQINSSKITFTIDRANPSVVLESPQGGSSLSPSEGYITFTYTPTDPSLSNCTLFPSSGGTMATRSDGIVPNVTSGKVATFKKAYSSDVNDLIWAVGCLDLAGNFGNSSTRTIDILVSGFSNIVSGSGSLTSSANKEYYVKDGKTLAVGDANKLPPQKKSNFLGQFGWVIALVGVVGILYLIFKWKPKR